jgi:hypothetical protein
MSSTTSTPWAGCNRGRSALPGEGGDNQLGGSLLQLAHEVDSILGGCGFDQQMKVLGHHYPADQEESGFVADLAQRLNKRPTEALTGE